MRTEEAVDVTLGWRGGEPQHASTSTAGEVRWLARYHREPMEGYRYIYQLVVPASQVSHASHLRLRIDADEGIRKQIAEFGQIDKARPGYRIILRR